MTMQALDPAGPGAPSSAVRLLDMAQTAARVGKSWERFRKVRLDWTRDRDFPAEINEPGEPVRYLESAVDAWVARRSRRVHAARAALDLGPAADLGRIEPPAADRAAGRHGRARLALLKGRPS